MGSGINAEMAAELREKSPEGNGARSSEDSAWGPAPPMLKSSVEHPGRQE